VERACPRTCVAGDGKVSVRPSVNRFAMRSCAAKLGAQNLPRKIDQTGLQCTVAGKPVLQVWMLVNL